MNEKDILKQSLKEIEEQLNSLGIPSEELKNIFDEIFRKLEMQMNQIGVSNRNLHDGIEEIKNSLESFNGEGDKGESKLSFTDRNGNKVEKYYDANLDDSTGYFLKNAITEALDEFGDALETKEKLSVLMQTIEELLEG